MITHRLLATAMCISLGLISTAHAGPCFPVNSEVVSLGEQAARYYATRSLDQQIEDRRQVFSASGRSVGRIDRQALVCSPFLNILGADEWQCRGTAKVCVEP